MKTRMMASQKATVIQTSGSDFFEVMTAKWPFHRLFTNASRMRRNNRSLLLIPLVFLGLFLMCHCAPKYEQVQPEKLGGTITVRFVIVEPDAGTVCVSGSFNSWSEQSNCMTRSGDVWSVGVSLPPGRYPYLLIVDGRNWREDPGCVLVEDNGFGTKNSVLIVE
jgi:hypothetical protein